MLKTTRDRKVWLISQPAHAELAGDVDQPAHEIVRRAAAAARQIALLGKHCAVNWRPSAARPLDKKPEDVHDLDDTVGARPTVGRAQPKTRLQEAIDAAKG